MLGLLFLLGILFIYDLRGEVSCDNKRCMIWGLDRAIDLISFCLIGNKIPRTIHIIAVRNSPTTNSVISHYLASSKMIATISSMMLYIIDVLKSIPDG